MSALFKLKQKRNYTQVQEYDARGQIAALPGSEARGHEGKQIALCCTEHKRADACAPVQWRNNASN